MHSQSMPCLSATATTTLSLIVTPSTSLQPSLQESRATLMDENKGHSSAVPTAGDDDNNDTDLGDDADDSPPERPATADETKEGLSDLG